MLGLSNGLINILIINFVVSCYISLLGQSVCCVKHLFSFTKATSMQPDPVISRLRPDRHFGSISEHMNRLIDNYMSANPDKVLTDILNHLCINL